MCGDAASVQFTVHALRVGDDDGDAEGLSVGCGVGLEVNGDGEGCIVGFAVGLVVSGC